VNSKLARSAASENLTQTYFALGLAIAGSTRRDEEGFSCCLGRLPHPICNFAARLDLDPWSVRRLRDAAAASPSFQVYHSPGDSPDKPESIMRRAGFQVSFRLVQMISEPREVSKTIELGAALEVDERMRLSAFMIDQFFSRQHTSFRRVVSQATADANLELYGYYESEEIAGAMMVCATEDCLGVYNLCVRSAKRSRGIGSKMVQWALAQGFEAGKQLTLQCDETLAPWYEALGFERVGVVTVYSLPKT
jgi:GNAT superfamily N-acetyltransferase